MKKFYSTVSIALLTLASAAASRADVFVPYNRWTALPHCGGSTRLICDGPRQNNECKIEFDDSYKCPKINLYTGPDFYPRWYTVENHDMQHSFWIDNDRVDWDLSVYFYMHDTGNHTYEKITYQFDY